MTTSNEPLATCEPAFDVFLRRGPEHVAGFVTDWYLPDYRAPICSPTRLASGPPDQVGSLERHTLLYSTTRPTVWSEWLNAAGAPDIKPHHSLVFEHTFQAVQGAVEDLGVAMGSWSLIMDDVAAGRLVLPFSKPKLRTDVYRAYTPIAKASDFVAARFCSWLQRVSAPIESS